MNKVAKFYRYLPVFVVLVCGGFMTPSWALQPGVEVKAGTLGLGADLSLGINEHWGGRIGFGRFTYDDEFTDEDDIEYSAELTLGGIYAFADWHPFGGGFRVTAGLVSNLNGLEGDAELASGANIDVGGTNYIICDANRNGDLCGMSAKISFNSTAPYLGIGWGSNGKNSGFSFGLDIGVMLQGEPKIDIDVDSPNGSVTDDDIAEEEENLEDELGNLINTDLYPVINIGVSYRF